MYIYFLLLITNKLNSLHVHKRKRQFRSQHVILDRFHHRSFTLFQSNTHIQKIFRNFIKNFIKKKKFDKKNIFRNQIHQSIFGKKKSISPLINNQILTIFSLKNNQILTIVVSCCSEIFPLLSKYKMYKCIPK